MRRWRIYNDSSFVILPAVQNGLAHAIGVLGALPFSLADVDVGDDLLPSCLNVQLGVLLLAVGLLADVFLGPFNFLILLLGQELLELPPAFLLLPLLLLPLSLLR